jgi:ferric-dicitrate binding protein FerR (iron transport regulator)
MRVAKSKIRMTFPNRIVSHVARSLSIALFAVAAMCSPVPGENPTSWPGWQAAHTPIGGVGRFPLGDGRTAQLNTNSTIHVSAGAKETDVVLNHGEVLIQGQSDNPIKVIASSTTLYAENASFSVRLHRSMGAQVLVATGSVGLSHTGDHFGQWVRSVIPFPWRQFRLAAGESASLAFESVSDRKTLSPEVIEHKLAWKDGWLWFSDETIPEAIERFNDYNPAKKLILTDSALDHVTGGGRFRPTEPDSLAASLKMIYGVKAQTRSAPGDKTTDIYLSGGCNSTLLRCDTPLGQ